MRCNPEKIVSYGYKLYVEVWPPFIYDLIFVVRKDSKMVFTQLQFRVYVVFFLLTSCGIL